MASKASRGWEVLTITRWGAVLACSVILAGVTAACAAPTQSISVGVPAAFVTSSARQTLAQKTADVTLTGTISAAGLTVPMHGTGQMNLTTQDITMTVNAHAAGRSLTEDELIVDGKVFIRFSTPNPGYLQRTGHRWVELPFNLSGLESSINSSDPVAAINLLESQGASVTQLGSRRINEFNVAGFSVTPTRASLVANADKLLQQSQLTSSEIADAEQQIQQETPPTITVWIDKSHLVRRVSMNMQIGGAGAGASGLFNVDFTHYGVPISVTPPDSADVMSYQEFAQMAGQQQGS